MLSHLMLVYDLTGIIFLFTAIISLEEFIAGAQDDEWIREMLACDPKSVKVERLLEGATGSKVLCSPEPSERQMSCLLEL